MISLVKRTFVGRFLHMATATCEQVPQKEGKKRTTMGTVLMTILLTGLFILFVLLLLAALVFSLARLMNGAGTHVEVTTSEDRQQRFLKASVLHLMNRAR